MFSRLLVVVSFVVLAACALVASEPPAPAPDWSARFVAAQAAETPIVAAPASASFRKTLSAAAERAYRDKQISRWDLARIRMAILMRPAAIAEAQACVLEDACQAGMIPVGAAGDVAAVDWSKILSFVISKLPDIIAIIKLFAV